MLAVSCPSHTLLLTRFSLTSPPAGLNMNRSEQKSGSFKTKKERALTEVAHLKELLRERNAKQDIIDALSDAAVTATAKAYQTLRSSEIDNMPQIPIYHSSDMMNYTREQKAQIIQNTIELFSPVVDAFHAQYKAHQLLLRQQESELDTILLALADLKRSSVFNPDYTLLPKAPIEAPTPETTLVRHHAVTERIRRPSDNSASSAGERRPSEPERRQGPSPTPSHKPHASESSGSGGLRTLFSSRTKDGQAANQTKTVEEFLHGKAV